MNYEPLTLLHPSIAIPETWTAEQALEIADFLNDVLSAIWAVHGSAMAHHLEPPRRLRASPAPIIDPDDEFPF